MGAYIPCIVAVRPCNLNESNHKIKVLFVVHVDFAEIGSAIVDDISQVMHGVHTVPAHVTNAACDSIKCSNGLRSIS